MCLKLLGFSAAVLRYQYCTSTNNRPCAPCAPPSDVHTSAVTLPVRHRDTIALVAGVATHASPPRSSGRFYAIPIGFFDQWRAQIFRYSPAKNFATPLGLSQPCYIKRSKSLDYLSA